MRRSRKGKSLKYIIEGIHYCEGCAPEVEYINHVYSEDTIESKLWRAWEDGKVTKVIDFTEDYDGEEWSTDRIEYYSPWKTRERDRISAGKEHKQQSGLCNKLRYIFGSLDKVE